VEPNLGRGRLTFLYDYPASQAALARIRPGNPAVAERFELYLDGVELANGFQELTDANEQRARFERDATERAQRGLAPVAADARLLAALTHGLPACSGVALGIDRLVMLAIGAASIADSVAFPSERA
jgi:elongation factor P--(R)-beta-lysine ligase